MPFCKVILLNNSQSFSNQADNSLTYSIPSELANEIHVGSFVFVPLLEKVVVALVIELQESINASFKIKEIIERIDPIIHLNQELIELVKYTGDYYATPYSQVLSTVISSANIPQAEREIFFKVIDRVAKSLTKVEEEVLGNLERCRGKKAKFNRLKAICKLPTAKLNKILANLEAQNCVEIKYLYKLEENLNKEGKNYLNNFESSSILNHKHLSAEQDSVYKEIENCFNETVAGASQNKNKFLIHGVTGSGKTEVYFSVISAILAKGKSTIILVPEISLAPQLIDRLKQRFPDDEILIWHSALEEREKLYSFMQLMKKDKVIVVGARSAIFSPVKNLGLIILDEEHENSYKQEQPAPRYHTRHIAEFRAKITGSLLITGSATPSVESYYKAKENPEWKLLNLKNRFNQNPLPEVEIVDMTEEFNIGNKSIFSKSLHALISDRLQKGEITLLFLNKRGNSSHVFCRNCGHIYKCSHCDSKMVYHSDNHLLICNLCNHSEAHPDSCPACGSNSIKYFGLGTQKLETETQKAFPEARISRLDSDIGKNKKVHLEIFNKLKDSQIDILIGTQMIAKGLDNPLITAVGVVAVDSCFTQLDYLAEERGFQLLTQVAGRAGRQDKEGKVIFQSYLSERPSLLLAKEQNYEKFYEAEIQLRKEFNYPPFSKLIRFISSSEDENLAIKNINAFHEIIYDRLSSQTKHLQILGPSQCQINRINKQFRYHILCKILTNQARDKNIPDNKNSSKKETDGIALELKEIFLSYKALSRTRLVIDVDSMSLV